MGPDTQLAFIGSPTLNVRFCCRYLDRPAPSSSLEEPLPNMFKFNTHLTFIVLIIACGSIPKGEPDPSPFPLPALPPHNRRRGLTHPQTGYDEGGFSASIGLPSFKEDFNLDPSNWTHDPSALASRRANISSFGVLGAAFGSILALAVTDRFGRLRSWQLFVLLWASGTLVQIFSSGILGLMLFARLWSGLGAGGLTVVAPLYLTEIAPTKTRGMVVSIYMVILLSVLTAGEC